MGPERGEGFPRVGWVRPPDDDEGGGRLSGDPLGLRVFVQHLAGRITPGLGRGQADVWGLGLLCAGVKLAGHDLRCEERYLRWQRLVLFAALHTAADRSSAADEDNEVKPTWRVGGIRNARGWMRRTGPVPLDVPLKADELTGGLWGGYARAARMYGLLATTGTVRLADHRLTENGETLASTTLQVLGGDRARLAGLIDGREAADVAELGLHVGEPPPGYLDELGELMRSGDVVWGSRLRWLWEQFEEVVTADPNELPADEPYDDDQATALRAARDVAELLAIVEGALRSDDPCGLTRGLTEHDAFAEAELAGYAPEYGPVRTALEPGGDAALDRLWQVHRDRHRAAGMWDRNTQAAPYEATRPDFGLDAPCALYWGGLRL